MRILSLSALIVFLFSTTSMAQTVHGVFRVVKGDVQVFSKSGSSAKAKIGQKVFPSDRIKAGKDSRAKIVMVDKNELNISPDSEIVIENYQYKPEENKKNVLINVLYGKVRAKVEQKYDTEKNKFQIKTPTAVAGVRGTDFITGFNKVDRTTQVVTFEGRVEFGLAGPNGTIANSVMVNVGQTTTMAGGAPPPAPTQIPKSELKQMDSSTNADGPPSPGATNGGASPRNVASVGAGGVMKTGDLPSDNGPQLPPILPGPPQLPIPQVFQQPPPIVNELIQTGTRKLSITINNDGAAP